MTTAFERLLDALTAATGLTPRGNDRTRQARCPAHDDHTPSLSISAGDGRALLHCQAGCDTDAVLDALGLTTGDLYDTPRMSNGTGPGTVEYPYHDEHGNVLYVVQRRQPKDFRQYRVVNGVKVWKLGDVRRVLFRLPQVLAAVAEGRTVYVAEGERDVLALEAAGEVATCNSGGAGKWRPEFAKVLAGAPVVVVADRDAVGYAHAEQVRASVAGTAASVVVVEAATGKDARDHLAAGHTVDELIPVTASTVQDTPPPGTPARRALRLTRASDIKVRPVHWLWTDRVALGTLALLGGREGIGKSTVAYTITADITRGRLPGAYADQPRAVIVAATEDSWAHTIVPRLIAAGADLQLVYRVEVTTAEGVHADLSLPLDLPALRQSVDSHQAALILLDPLMSRLDTSLDTHKDAEVRTALEPLVRLANAANVAVLGLIHVNKSTSTDPLTTIMASRAFTAVARAVLFAMTDPDDETTRLLGQPKNNLGRTDLPTLIYRIESAHVADTEEGPVFTGRVNWLGETDRTVREVLEAAGETAEFRTAVAEAADWLADFLTSVGGTSESNRIKEAGRREGHSASSLKRARAQLKIQVSSSGYPRSTYWATYSAQDARSVQSDALPPSSGTNCGETGLTEPTEPTGQTTPLIRPVRAVGSVGPVGPAPHARARVDDDTTCPNCGFPHDTIGHQVNCERGTA